MPRLYFFRFSFSFSKKEQFNPLFILFTFINLTHSHTHSHTHSLSHTHSHTHTYTHTHSLSLSSRYLGETKHIQIKYDGSKFGLAEPLSFSSLDVSGGLSCSLFKYCLFISSLIFILHVLLSSSFSSFFPSFLLPTPTVNLLYMPIPFNKTHRPSVTTTRRRPCQQQLRRL